jgi:dinuclear metal center YbgI/SA1388 family protein
MPVTLRNVAQALNEFAPERLAEPWDNVGLQLGDPDMAVARILTVLECDLQTVDEAVRIGANCIVAHHPLIFRPLKSIQTDTYQGETIAALLRENIGFICAHTNLDKSPQGTNRVMTDILTLKHIRLLHPPEGEAPRKLVVFAPVGHEKVIIDAIDEAGGGRIGHYSKCTFRTEGTGTFEGDETTNPVLGEAGIFQQVLESRIEAIVPADRVNAVVEAVIAAHPYEEVAYDLYRLDQKADSPYGLGLRGELDLATPIWRGQVPTLEEFATRCRELFQTSHVLVVGDRERPVRRVAVSSGSGGHSIQSLTGDGFDVLVTGEITFHHAVEARYKEMAVVCVGHFASETFVAEALVPLLGRAFPEVPVSASRTSRDPIWQA